jgi:hypothetical protein
MERRQSWLSAERARFVQYHWSIADGTLSLVVCITRAVRANNTALLAGNFELSTDLKPVVQGYSTADRTAGSGTHTAMAGDETFFQSPNAEPVARKLAEFFNAVNTKGQRQREYLCNVNDNRRRLLH